MLSLSLSFPSVNITEATAAVDEYFLHYSLLISTDLFIYNLRE